MPRLEFFQRVIMTFTALALLSSCVSKNKYDALETRYQQLSGRLSSQIVANQMQIARLQESIKVTLNDELLFPSGGWQMPGEAQRAIAPLAAVLASMQQTKIMVNGYTDNRPIGREHKCMGITSNLVLSQKRADSVMNFMVAQGVNPGLVSAQGFGDADPVASNDTAAGRAQNRGVELMLAGSDPETSPNALPPTRIVSSPSASPSQSAVSPNSRPVAGQQPSIVWHRINGRWHWHCVAHCSKYRNGHERLEEERNNF
jgi:chemotaxis protein MotB